MSRSRTSRPRTWGAQGWIRAGVLAAGTGAVVLAAQAAPVHPPKAAAPTARAAAMPVDAASLVCPGGEGKDAATLALASAPMQLSSMLGGGGQLQVNEAGHSSAVTLARGHSMTRTWKNGPLDVVARGASAPGITATQFHEANGAMSAQACTQATAEAWIPVGDKQPGRLLTVTLVNPGARAVSVDVDVRAADGALDSAAIADKAVPAHGRVSVNIPADALAHAAAVVHVRSEDGAVVASVRDRVGETERKGDDVAAQYAPPAPVQEMPGVPVVDRSVRVRLAAPGSRAAVVRLQASGKDAGDVSERVVTVPVGRSLDVTLDGIDDDVAAVRASSQENIIASAFASSASKKSRDFTWVPAAPALDAAAGASLDGARHAGRLVVMGEGRATSVTLVVSDPSGKATRRRLDVPANGWASVDVPKNATVWLLRDDGSADAAPVHAAVLVRDVGADQPVTSVPLVPTPWLRAPVEVTQR